MCFLQGRSPLSPCRSKRGGTLKEYCAFPIGYNIFIVEDSVASHSSIPTHCDNVNGEEKEEGMLKRRNVVRWHDVVDMIRNGRWAETDLLLRSPKCRLLQLKTLKHHPIINDPPTKRSQTPNRLRLYR